MGETSELQITPGTLTKFLPWRQACLVQQSTCSAALLHMFGAQIGVNAAHGATAASRKFPMGRAERMGGLL